MPAYLLVIYQTDDEGRRLLQEGDVRIDDAIEMVAALEDCENSDCTALAEELQDVIGG